MRRVREGRLIAERRRYHKERCSEQVIGHLISPSNLRFDSNAFFQFRYRRRYDVRRDIHERKTTHREESFRVQLGNTTRVRFAVIFYPQDLGLIRETVARISGKPILAPSRPALNCVDTASRKRAPQRPRNQTGDSAASFRESWETLIS